MPAKKGALGEALAANFLRRQGWVILARNVKNRFGEIDLIAQDRKEIVFVEVKSLWGEGMLPEESIRRGKLHHLKKAALLYLQEQNWLSRPVRFDVVAINFLKLPPQSSIRHLKGILLS